jgi:hypothetical protein
MWRWRNEMTRRSFRFFFQHTPLTRGDSRTASMYKCRWGAQVPLMVECERCVSTAFVGVKLGMAKAQVRLPKTNGTAAFQVRTYDKRWLAAVEV